MAVHFVGFRDSTQFQRAVAVFGQPDFIHRRWDVRAKQEIVGSDIAVFATGAVTDRASHPSFDDSTCF
jgi:hypothetical protein